MAANRRDFIKLSALTLGLSLIDYPLYGRTNNWIKTLYSEKSVMKLSFSAYNLLLKHVFTVASNSRTTTPVVLTQIEYQGLVGYGEASMPPYLGETQIFRRAYLHIYPSVTPHKTACELNRELPAQPRC